MDCNSTVPSTRHIRRNSPAGPVNTKRLVNADFFIQQVGNLLGIVLGLDQSKATELGSGARDRISHDKASVHIQARFAIKAVLLQQLINLVVVDIWENDALLDREADLSIRILIREIRNISALVLAETPNGNSDPNTGFALLELGMNAKGGSLPLTHVRGESTKRFSEIAPGDSVSHTEVVRCGKDGVLTLEPEERE